MIKDLKNLLKHSGIYSIGNMATKVVGILLIPLYTSPGIITPELYGIYSLLEVVMIFIIGILPVGIPNALFRWLSLEKYKSKRGSILFSSFLASGLIVIAFLAMSVPFAEELSLFFFHDGQFEKSIIAICFIITFRQLNNINLACVRFDEKSLFFIIISISRLIFQLLVIIYFVAFVHLGIFGIFLGQMSGELFSLILSSLYVFKQFQFRFDIQEIKKMMKYGFPLTFSEISHRILNMGDRIILQILTNSVVVGLYAIGYKFANLIDTIYITAFRNAFVPAAWKKLEEKNAKYFYSKMLTYYSFFIFWIALFMSVFAKEIMLVFTRDKVYWDGYKVVPLVVLAIGIRGIFIIIKMGLQYTKNTKYIAYIVSSAAIFNIGLNFLLIPYWGMIGAAVATLVAFVYMVVAGNIVANKFYPMQFEWIKVLSVISVGFILYLLSLINISNYFVILVLFKLFLCIIYPGILYIFRFYDKTELQVIGTVLRQKR